MPTYLCHGFRWKRRSIRVYVVVQNLDDAAPEWIIRRGSPRNLIESFYSLFDFLPECAFLPTLSSSTAPQSISGPQSVDRASVAESGSVHDDDATSYHTTRSRKSRSRSRSRSQSVSTIQRQRSQHFDLRDHETLTLGRQSSNSSRKRHGSKTRTSDNNPPVPQASQSHHAPPSPPSSQPRFPSTSHMSNGSTWADPVLAQEWAPVKLLEEYDPANLDEVSKPYAYVADYVTRIDSSCSIVEEIQRYEARVRSSGAPAVTGPSSDEMLNGKRDTTKLGRGAGWFEQLRDQLQRDEEIRWYVVVNGDEEREWPAGGGSGVSAQPESRSSIAHHAQHTHQPSVLEGQYRDLEAKREQLRRELGFEQGGVDRLLDRRPERRTKPPMKELPPLKTDFSSSTTASTPPKTPKTPSKGGFRRFFSKSKSSEEAPP